MKEITKSEQERIESSPIAEKIDYFLKEAVANKYTITVRNDESVLRFYENTGLPCIPFWPHASFTKEIIESEWKDCYPTAIRLSSFISHWLPGMEKDGVQIALYAKPNEEIVLMNPGDLRKKLEFLKLPSCCQKTQNSKINLFGGME